MNTLRTKEIELELGAYYLIEHSLCQKPFTAKMLEDRGGMIKVKIVKGEAQFEHSLKRIGDIVFLTKQLCLFRKVTKQLCLFKKVEEAS